MLRSLDTETTGLDLRHGAKPFFVTFCDLEHNTTFWEWDVDPFTREPIIPPEDIYAIDEIAEDSELVLQNPKFDFVALRSIGCNCSWKISSCHDTLMGGHLLASNHLHDLTTQAREFLRLNIKPYEDALEKACQEARRLARSKYPKWRIAEAGLPEMPSAKEKVWKNDMWLLRALAKEEGYAADHPWYTMVAEYANADSFVTVNLHVEQMRLFEEKGLVSIYAKRLELLPIILKMEDRGVTYSSERLTQLRTEYIEESAYAERVCVNIAKQYGHDLTLPKAGSNKSLEEFVFNVLELQVLERSKKTKKPSLNKKAIEAYQALLPKGSKSKLFMEKLRAKRQRDTAVSYMDGYQKFMFPVSEGWACLHPSLNPTGTDTLRWSSSHPNEQNISKQKGFNLRYCFGPLPGRVWYSLDAQNIELRLPAFEAGEDEMIALFERPDDPPYFGSNHLLVFDILHPELFKEHGAAVKDIFKSTWYQWTKNGNFAVQYGAIESSGTADRAYNVPGGQKLIQARFSNIAKLNERMIAHAEEYGYVETMPDKTVCPERGYPLLCTRTERGGILPTVPLNYHIQGTACWWMMKAMIRCQEYLDTLNDALVSRGLEPQYFMVMQVHDELVFDFPDREDNLPIIREIKRLMELSGDDLGIPTPVSCELHESNWSEGVSVKF